MSWNHPLACWGFVAAILIVYCIMQSRKRRVQTLQQAFGNDMRARLFSERSGVLTTIKRVALLIAVVSFLVALCGPRYGQETELRKSFGRDLFVVFDVSDSMLAEDVSPNRLSVAKLDVEDLLDSALGDRIGLITFSGSAQVEIPLTTDYEFFRSLLRKVDPSTIKVGGTAIGDAIRLALHRFGSNGEREKAIVLITDGEDHDSLPLEAARQAAELNAPIYAIAIGTENGAKIPTFDVAGRRIGYKRFDGEEIVSKPDVTLLRELAKISNGRFYYADAQLDLGAVYRSVIDSQKRSELSETARLTLKDRYQTFLGLGLISFLVYYATPSYRKRKVGKFPITSLPTTSLIVIALLASTSSTSNLFAADVKRVDEIKEYNRSLALVAEDNFNEFISRQEELSSAKNAVVSERAHFNLGVAAFDRAQSLTKELDDQIASHSIADQTNRESQKSSVQNPNADRIAEYNRARDLRRQKSAEILEATHESARHFIQCAEHSPKSQTGKLYAQTVIDTGSQSRIKQGTLERELRNEALAQGSDHAEWLRGELTSQIEEARKIKKTDISPDYFRALDQQRINVLSIKEDMATIINRLFNQTSLPDAANAPNADVQTERLLDEKASNVIDCATKEYESRIEAAAQRMTEYDVSNALGEIQEAKSRLELVQAVATDYDKLVLQLEASEQQLSMGMANGSALNSPEQIDDHHWNRQALKLISEEMIRKAEQIVDRSNPEQQNEVISPQTELSSISSKDEDEISFDSNDVKPEPTKNRDVRILESAQTALKLGDELVDSVCEAIRLTDNKETLIPEEQTKIADLQIRITEIMQEIAKPLKDDNQQNQQSQQQGQDSQSNQNNQDNQDKSQNNSESTPNELNSPENNQTPSQSEKEENEKDKNQEPQNLESEKVEEQKKQSSQPVEKKTEPQKEADALMKRVERRQKDAAPQRRAVQQALKKKEKTGKDW